MEKTTVIVILIMVITGALNTISATLQIAVPSRNKDGKLAYFEHYYVQTLFMMLGETMCMVAYYCLKYYHRDHPEIVDGAAKPMNPLVMWPAAFMDILATSLDYMGLAFLKDAGLFQMLRVTPMIWCAILSMPILRQKVRWFQWVGMVVIVGGIFIKAIPDLFKNQVFDHPPDSFHVGCVEELGPNETSLLYPGTNLTLWGPGWTFSEEEEESDDSCGRGCQMAVGIIIILVGEFFHGCQFVYEQKYMNEYDLHPLKVVGFEGICGVLTLAVLLWPAYFIRFEKSGIMAGVALGPEGRFEDAIDAFVMIFDGNQGHSGKHENNYWLLGWTLGNMCSIAVFNWAGITVAKLVDATTRSVLDQLRTVIIWAAFLVPFGTSLCRVQQYFHYTAPIGLMVMVSGVWIFSDIIIMPLVRRCLGKSKEESS